MSARRSVYDGRARCRRTRARPSLSPRARCSSTRTCRRSTTRPTAHGARSKAQAMWPSKRTSSERIALSMARSRQPNTPRDCARRCSGTRCARWARESWRRMHWRRRSLWLRRCARRPSAPRTRRQRNALPTPRQRRLARRRLARQRGHEEARTARRRRDALHGLESARANLLLRECDLANADCRRITIRSEYGRATTAPSGSHLSRMSELTDGQFGCRTSAEHGVFEPGCSGPPRRTAGPPCAETRILGVKT